MTPLIVMVAPNGSRRTKADHARLPITPAEIADEALRCADAGATILHLHVRNRDGHHALDPALYRAAIEAVEGVVGKRMAIQITTEALGRYSVADQMTVVRQLHPEAVSLALTDLIPDDGAAGEAAAFLSWLKRERIAPQYILDTPNDVAKFHGLRRRGVIPQGRPCTLFVLGSDSEPEVRPRDVLPYLKAHDADCPWAVSAFGPERDRLRADRGRARRPRPGRVRDQSVAGRRRARREQCRPGPAGGGRRAPARPAAGRHRDHARFPRRDRELSPVPALAMPRSQTIAGSRLAAAPRLTRGLACLAAAVLLIATAGPRSPAQAQAASANVSAEQAARFGEQAVLWQRQLTDQIMPYWYDTAVDREAGGYLLRDAITPEKLVVTQARLIWGFAHAYRLGLRDPKRDYLEAAAQGYRFLQQYFLDPEDGGYYWATNRVGQVINNRKFLYGQAFVIYALVEYYRASGDRKALDQATELYRTVQAHGRDPENGGWTEHFEHNWRPLLEGEARIDIGIVGMKSGDALLHWMEALTALESVTRAVGGDAAVRDLELETALAEALDLNTTYFFPEKPGQAYPYRYPDWRRPIGGTFKQISYGTNVEFAWLMLDAERALSRPPDWDRFDAILRHALDHGFDQQRGGLYQLGFENRPAAVTDKVWWAQAELLAALTESLSQRPNPAYATALEPADRLPDRASDRCSRRDLVRYRGRRRLAQTAGEGAQLEGQLPRPARDDQVHRGVRRRFRPGPGALTPRRLFLGI